MDCWVCSDEIAFCTVDSTREMLGTFSPQAELYTYLTPEESTPSGIFARGSYSARTKVNNPPETLFQTPLQQCSLHLHDWKSMTERGCFGSPLYQFLDDDRKCYLEMNYTFDIRRDWPSN
jgi:Rho GDP-dissociation inhibitor